LEQLSVVEEANNTHLRVAIIQLGSRNQKIAVDIENDELFIIRDNYVYNVSTEIFERAESMWYLMQ
jgi:hypothetical protein